MAFGRMISVVACALMIAGCSDKERLYSADEIGLIVEWAYGGWSVVRNETRYDVTLTTSYYQERMDDVVTLIPPGGSARLESGAFLPGVSLGECRTAVLSFSDGVTMECSHFDAPTPWSEYLFGNVQEKLDYEVVAFGSKKVRHDLVIQTYHIDNHLRDLWLKSLE